MGTEGISIHLMFLLITSTKGFPSSASYFNTSHVSINHLSVDSHLPTLLHFNTSHVSINRVLKLMQTIMLSNFNTSHVSINQSDRSGRKAEIAISIHLMFLLIKTLYNNICVGWHFNTSHVSINLDAVSSSNSAVIYFNTSHVSINPARMSIAEIMTNISIHLMFLLIQRFYQLFRFYYISNSLKIPAFSNFSQV